MNASPDRRPMKGIGRVTFMTHLADITAALDAGWPVKAVYESHRDRLGISYPQFARYVARIVRRRVPGQAELPLPVPPARLARPEPDVSVGITTSGEASNAPHRAGRTFNHDTVERPDDRRRFLGED